MSEVQLLRNLNSRAGIVQRLLRPHVLSFNWPGLHQALLMIHISTDIKGFQNMSGGSGCFETELIANNINGWFKNSNGKKDHRLTMNHLDSCCRLVSMPRCCDTNCLQGEESGWNRKGGIFLVWVDSKGLKDTCCTLGKSIDSLQQLEGSLFSFLFPNRVFQEKSQSKFQWQSEASCLLFLFYF